MTFYDDAVNTAAKYIKSLGVGKEDIERYAEDLDMYPRQAFIEFVFDGDIYEELSDEGYDNLADEISIYLSDNIDYSDSEFEQIIKSQDSIHKREIEYFVEWCDAQGFDLSDKKLNLILSVKNGSDLFEIFIGDKNLYDEFESYLRDSTLLESFSPYGEILAFDNNFWSDVYNKL